MAGPESANLDSTLLSQLNALSKARRVSRDQLVNTAVRDYLRRIAAQQRETRELASAAGALAAYRQRDPDSEQAIDAFVTDEAAGAATDPVEGESATSDRPLRASLDAILHG